MQSENYVPQKISSKSDISLYLQKNIESFKDEARDVLENGDFNNAQKQTIENIMRQYYYALSDIAKAINLLNE